MFEMTLEEKKRKKTQFLKEAFITEDIRVDGMNRNLIPPHGVVSIECLIIKEPDSRIFYINRNTDVVFQRETRTSATSTLAMFEMTLEEKKRKKTQFLKEAFITEDIRVDGMNRNLIPPHGVVSIECLIIKEPDSRIFYINRNTDV
nr:hypothetical protein [Tanacetum cinerariifolium]